LNGVQLRIKLNVNKTPLKLLPNDNIALSSLNAIMIGNNCCISRVFTDRMCKNFDLMYSQYAFVHWYLREEWKKVNLFKQEKI